LSRAIKGRGGRVALGNVIVIVVVDFLLLAIIAVAIPGAAALARRFVVFVVVILVVIIIVRIVVIVVPLEHGLVIDGEGVLQGMHVVLLVDGDLVQIDVDDERVEGLVATADKLEIDAEQIFDVDFGIVRFYVGLSEISQAQVDR